ncbi:MAG: PilZ domain-containing protein [Leptospiraceae bacterium]|nr:PilZ domain-containing protein [Leptospiraceae bacterium]
MKERRKSARFRAQFDLSINASVAGISCNLSADGLQFVQRGELPVGSELKIKLQIPGVSGEFSIDAGVLRCEPIGSNGDYLIAVQFRMLRSRSGRTLADVLSYLALRGRNPYPLMDIHPEWRPLLFSNDMSTHWRGIDINGERCDLIGCNYYPLPAPLADVSYSARFDPRSVYFLSWVGVYVLPPLNGQRIPISVYTQLVNKDNRAWLRLMGDPNPVSDMEYAPMECVERNATGEPIRWSVVQHCVTHSDLGSNNPRVNVPRIMSVNDALWSGRYESYQNADHSPIFFEAWYESDYLIISFVSCTEIVDRTGNTMRNADDPHFRAVTGAMQKSIRIIDDGSGYRGPPR